MAFLRGVLERGLKPRKQTKKMSDSEVVAFLSSRISKSLNDEGGELSQIRQENFNYYVGKEYGDEQEGYSKFVTREGFETVEWVLPHLLRMFTSGDKLASFDPIGPEDEEQAEQETDITWYFLQKANGGRGFLAIHHLLKDLLLYPNSYTKVTMDWVTETDVGMLTGIDATGVAVLSDDPNVEILEQDSRIVEIEIDPSVNMAPAFPSDIQAIKQPLEVFDLKIRTTISKPQLRIDPVPPEECLVDPECTTLDLDEAFFVAHRVKKSYTQLVHEGYDRKKLDEIGTGEDHSWNTERVNRLFYEDEDPNYSSGYGDPSLREFWVHEVYGWIDYDGDGVAEFRRMVLIGGTLFDNEETNYQPLIAGAAILVPHKHTGLSYMDAVKDMQLLGSELTRQLLDNIYKINVRRKFLSEDSLTEDGGTMEAILDIQSEWVPVRGVAQNAAFPEATNSIVSEILPVIQHFSEYRKVRSGVAPETSLNPEMLREATVGAFTGALEQASQRIEMLIRIVGETVIRSLMLKVHQLLRTHWDIPTTVKLRGKWVPVDPQGWRERTDMSINVGLGFNNKQQMIGMLTQLLGLQKESMAAGMATPSHLYNTLEKLVANAGVGDIRQYFIDPKTQDYTPPQPQPDPNMLLAQAQMKALEEEQKRKVVEMQLKQQKDAQELQEKQRATQVDILIRSKDLELRERELAVKEAELSVKYEHATRKALVDIENIAADSALKHAQADKAMTEAASTALEIDSNFIEAKKIVEMRDNQGGEMFEINIETNGESADDDGKE